MPHVHEDGSVCHNDHRDGEQMLQHAHASNLIKKFGKQQEDYAFWNTQPVPKMDEHVDKASVIEADVPFDQIPKIPLNLPKGFEWSELDTESNGAIDELQTFLADNYLEDFNATFRFTYSNEILKWALTPPGYKKDWLPCVRVASTKKLVGFIAATPCTIQVDQEKKKMAEINFLCVHKKLRSKRLAPVLIREITRRVHLYGIFQAFYTAGVLLPKPISSCQYFHRQINPKKLIETEFSYLKKNMTLARTIKLHKLPDRPQIPGFRPATIQDLDSIMALYQKYMGKFSFHPIFDKQEARHFLLPQDKALSVFVVEDPETKHVVEFIGFFTIDNHVLDHPVHKNIKAAFLWYYAPRSLETLSALVNDVIIAAKNSGHDVFNCMSLMDNETFLKELKFGPGDASLHFYLYNYRCPDIPTDKQAFLII